MIIAESSKEINLIYKILTIVLSLILYYILIFNCYIARKYLSNNINILGGVYE